ncbi:MAG: hypothetical protein DRO94_03505 [Candidatus Altiarchaeales archaeon]|nr:MAG: hypothetical protein DRO95_05415 [Candidatus Altiarchaeales archaeon]RLI94171.1 MAG: hypothetical protein DRO94_03505 [Candidatus Altiarchaeales archaeon]
MKRDVNFILFGILILLIMSMVGMALYSDYTYHEINEKYREFKKKLDEAQRKLNETNMLLIEREMELNETERQLIDIINELNLSKQKISSLGEYYKNLRGRNEELEEELNKVKDDRDLWKSNYFEVKEDLGFCNQSLKLCNSQLYSKDLKIEKLRVEINNFNSYLEEINEGLDNMTDFIIFNVENTSLREGLIEEVNSLRNLIQDIQAKLVTTI